MTKDIISIDPTIASDSDKNSDQYKIYQALLISLRDDPAKITEIITSVDGKQISNAPLSKDSIKLKKHGVNKDPITQNHTAECCYQFMYNNQLVKVQLTNPIKKFLKDDGEVEFAIIGAEIGAGGEAGRKIAEVQYLDKNNNEIKRREGEYVVKTMKLTATSEVSERKVQENLKNSGEKEVTFGNQYAKTELRSKGEVLRTASSEMQGAYRQDVLMPKIAGVTLKKKSEEKLSTVACFELMDELLDQLKIFYDNTNNYQHGDFTRNNVIIHNNEPTLIDFTNAEKKYKEDIYHATPKYRPSMSLLDQKCYPHADYYAFGIMFFELLLEQFSQQNAKLKETTEYKAIAENFKQNDRNQYFRPKDSFELYKAFALKYKLHDKHHPIWDLFAVLQQDCQSVQKRNEIHQQAKEKLANIILREKEKEKEKEFLLAVKKESKKLKQAYAEEFQQEIIGIGVGVFGDKKIILPDNNAQKYVIQVPIALAKPLQREAFSQKKFTCPSLNADDIKLLKQALGDKVEEFSKINTIDLATDEAKNILFTQAEIIAFKNALQVMHKTASDQDKTKISQLMTKTFLREPISVTSGNITIQYGDVEKINVPGVAEHSPCKGRLKALHDLADKYNLAVDVSKVQNAESLKKLMADNKAIIEKERHPVAARVWRVLKAVCTLGINYAYRKIGPKPVDDYLGHTHLSSVLNRINNMRP